MGKSDVKLHRFLSVPSNVALCGRKEFSAFIACDKDPCDTDKLFVRQTSIVFQIRSTLSSATKTEKSPEGLYFSRCTSDINNQTIKGNTTFTCNTFDSEMVRNMPMLRDARNRRTALGNIFQDTSVEDLDNLLSVYDNRTNSENTGNMPGRDIHHRRPALADVFQDLDEDDQEHLLSLFEETTGHEYQDNDTCEVTNFRRREALPDISANISKEQFMNLVQKCRHDIERLDSMEINEVEMPRRCRRFAKGDIFSDLKEEDMRRILAAREVEINDEKLSEYSGSVCRRFALGNIFNDVSEDDLLRIVSMFEAETEHKNVKDEQEKTDERTHVNNRRFALADIFQNISEDDLIKLHRTFVVV